MRTLPVGAPLCRRLCRIACRSGKRQMVRKRDQTGGSDGPRAADDHRRCFADPPGHSWLRSINQAPHATPELSRWCRARRPTRHFEQIPSKTIPANRIWRYKGVGSVEKQIIKSGQFVIRGLSIWRDRPSINPKIFASFPFASFPTVCTGSRVSDGAAPTR